jgi:hypothetical protein
MSKTCQNACTPDMSKTCQNACTPDMSNKKGDRMSSGFMILKAYKHQV